MSEARQLRFISGKYQGGTYALSEGCEVIMGRGMDAGLTLFEEMVSRHHAKFVVIEGEVSVEDMKSKNGTFVNGERIDRCQLEVGDRILMGTSILRLESLSDDAKAGDEAAAGHVDEGLDSAETEKAAALETTVPSALSELELDSLDVDESELTAVLTDTALHPAFSEGEDDDSDDSDDSEIDLGEATAAGDTMALTDAMSREEAYRARWSGAPLGLSLAHPMQPSLEFLSPEQLTALQAAHNHGDMDGIAEALRKDDAWLKKTITFLLRSGYLSGDSASD